MERPMKLQSGVYWNNVEAWTSTSIVPLKVILWDSLCNTDQFVILHQGFNTSTSPRIQACDTRPFPCERVGSGHETTLQCLVAWTWICNQILSSQMGSGNETKTAYTESKTRVQEYFIACLDLAVYSRTPSNTHDIMDNCESPDCPSIHFNT